VATTRTLSRNLLADQVKDRLLEGILSGEYLPDSRIVETQIARELNTSQAPVREALRALEALGVVEITPFKGARVRRPARREIIEAYAVRSALESLGARLAVPRLTDDDLAELAGYCQAMQVAARAGDAHGVAESDARFHERLLEIGDNRTLHTVWTSLEPFLRTYITLVVPGADPQWSADLHAPVMAALQRRDTEGAVAALTEHFIEASDNLARRWLDDETPPTEAPADGDASAAARAHPSTIEPRPGDRPLTGLRPVSIIDNR
jgi:DNA-binding GntR family transcriptional regulator